MLAARADDKNIKYPVMVSPKLDGVRALIIGGVVMSRSLKPIPNRFVQKTFGLNKLTGLDGELIVGKPNDSDVYRKTVSGVMSIEGEPSVKFYVFDNFININAGFKQRLVSSLLYKSESLEYVKHQFVNNDEALFAAEQQYLLLGYEGIMLRHPHGLYKYGRSTQNEGWLLKLKRFADSEAIILGSQELQHNSNEIKTNELGYKSRSSHKAGKVNMGVLGALHVRDTKTGVEFDIGTGFTQQDRQAYWYDKENLLGKLVKYKYFSSGSKDKPRFPVFIGFRDLLDL